MVLGEGARLDPRRPAGLIWEGLAASPDRCPGHKTRCPPWQRTLAPPGLWPSELPSSGRRAARRIPGAKRGAYPRPGRRRTAPSPNPGLERQFLCMGSCRPGGWPPISGILGIRAIRSPHLRLA